MDNKKIVVRKTNGLEIVCLNSRAIYVRYKYGINCYHRWFSRKRGFYYNNWRPFRRAITDHRYLDISYINYLANKYEISISASKKLPEYSDKEVKTLSERGRVR